jgi:integrase
MTGSIQVRDLKKGRKYYCVWRVSAEQEWNRYQQDGAKERRETMRGSIQKKGTTYYIVLAIGPKRKWLKAGPNKKEAERMLVQEVARLHSGPYRELKKITFAEFARKWMSDYARGSIKASTYESYESVMRTHLVPFFGVIELGKITLEDVQRYVATKQQEGRVKPKTINNTLVPLKEMFTHAVRWGYLRENPAHYVEKPRVPHYEMDFLTKEEIHCFLSAAPQDHYPFFLAAILTGMRLGELLAMKWSNLDWHRSQYFVKESLYKGRFVDPKSAHSKRAINLPQTLIEVLRMHKARQSERRLQVGEAYQDRDLIFCTALGTPLDRGNVVKREFWPLLKQAGLRRIRFHDLRHTFATLLIAQAESPKYIQAQLGHASIQVTMDRYGHLLPDVNRQAARRLEDSLFGPSVRKPLENPTF